MQNVKRKITNVHAVKHSKVRLHIINNGLYSQIADFGKNFHDAFKFMNILNDELENYHGKFSPSIFHFITCKVDGKNATYITSTKVPVLSPFDINDYEVMLQRFEDNGKLKR